MKFVCRTAYVTLKRYNRVSLNMLLVNTWKFQVRKLSIGHMDFKLPFNPAFNVEEPTISPNKNHLCIEWKSENVSNKFYAVWLRHQCHCTECFQASSGENSVHPDFLNPPISLENVRRNSDSLSITWKYGDGHIHKGFLPLQWLYQMRKIPSNCIFPPKFELHTLEFDEILSSEESLYNYLSLLNKFGVVKVVNSSEEKACVKLAEAISFRYNSCYGLEWEVKSVDDPVSSSYSDVGLMHHIDLPYLANVPGLQHLNCVRMDPCVKGGILTLKNIFEIAEKFRLIDPESFKSLSSISVIFHHITFRLKTYFDSRSPHIILNRNNEITNIIWSPFVQGPVVDFQDPNILDSYFRAYTKFYKYVESYQAKADFFFKKGDIVSFHNYRMVHGRTKIHLNGGVRHLYGCYTPIDEFRSRLRFLSIKLGKQMPPKIF